MIIWGLMSPTRFCLRHQWMGHQKNSLVTFFYFLVERQRWNKTKCFFVGLHLVTVNVFNSSSHCSSCTTNHFLLHAAFLPLTICKAWHGSWRSCANICQTFLVRFKSKRDMLIGYSSNIHLDWVSWALVLSMWSFLTFNFHHSPISLPHQTFPLGHVHDISQHSLFLNVPWS